MGVLLTQFMTTSVTSEFMNSNGQMKKLSKALHIALHIVQEGLMLISAGDHTLSVLVLQESRRGFLQDRKGLVVNNSKK